jgi:uncharacterized protein (AIM24 family)
MTVRSVTEFVQATAQDDAAHQPFQLENPYLLEVNLNGRVWARAGAMIAYTGQVRFTREGLTEHGVGRMLKKMASGEGSSLMKVEGAGRVYLADRGKKVQLLRLQGDTIVVNGNDLLAFEDGVEWDITIMRQTAGVVASGLFNVRLSGTGTVAMTTHYDPMTLQIAPDQPVFTDPNATVAWSGSLSPEFHTDISFRTLMGRSSGESIQMRFAGRGWVVLQPYEEA